MSCVLQAFEILLHLAFHAGAHPLYVLRSTYVQVCRASIDRAKWKHLEVKQMQHLKRNMESRLNMFSIMFSQNLVCLALLWKQIAICYATEVNFIEEAEKNALKMLEMCATFEDFMKEEKPPTSSGSKDNDPDLPGPAPKPDRGWMPTYRHGI